MRRQSIEACATQPALQRLLAVDALQQTLGVLGGGANARQADLLQLASTLLVAYLDTIPDCRKVCRCCILLRRWIWQRAGCGGELVL